MEIKINAKILGRGEADVQFSCSAEELSVMLSDPVYQELGEALIKKLQDHGNDRKVSDNRQQNHGNDRFEHMRRVMEAEQKAQQAHNKTVDTAIKNLQEQLNRMFNRIVQNKF